LTALIEQIDKFRETNEVETDRFVDVKVFFTADLFCNEYF